MAMGEKIFVSSYFVQVFIFAGLVAKSMAHILKTASEIYPTVSNKFKYLLLAEHAQRHLTHFSGMK